MLDAFSDLEGRGMSSHHQLEAESMRDQLLEQCAVDSEREDEHSLPLDLERLDEMAAGIAADANSRSRRAASSGRIELARMLNRLAGLLGSVNCDRCARAAGAAGPCGSQAGSEPADRDGECLVDLRSLYDSALALGTRLYADACGPAFVGEIDVELRVHILAANTPTRGCARLTGRTDFEEHGGRRRSVVTIGVDGRNYGQVERDAAAYYLVHEIVAHAFYDVRAGVRRAHRDPHDLWAEGWMDCIAADLLQRVVEGGGATAIRLPARLRANGGCMGTVARCHAERYDPPTGTRSHNVNEMRLARRRYLAMRYRLRELDPASAFDAVRSVQLASAIVNANGGVDETVAAISSAAAAFVFGAEQGGMLTTEELRFYAALSSFVDHRDEKRLVEELA